MQAHADNALVSGVYSKVCVCVYLVFLMSPLHVWRTQTHNCLLSVFTAGCHSGGLRRCYLS